MRIQARISLKPVPASQALGGVLRARFLGRQGLGPKPALYSGALLDQIGYGITSACLGALLLPVGRGGVSGRERGLGRTGVQGVPGDGVLVPESEVG